MNCVVDKWVVLRVKGLHLEQMACIEDLRVLGLEREVIVLIANGLN